MENETNFFGLIKKHLIYGGISRDNYHQVRKNVAEANHNAGYVDIESQAADADKRMYECKHEYYLKKGE